MTHTLYDDDYEIYSEPIDYNMFVFEVTLTDKYGKSTFTMEIVRNKLTITIIDTSNETLKIPRCFEGHSIYGLNFYEHLMYCKNVKTLILPNNLKEIRISDFSFPCLEEILLEEGSDFYLEENRLYKRNGSLLNYFRKLKLKSPLKGRLPDEFSHVPNTRGNALMLVSFPMETVRLHPGITDIYEDAFMYHAPVHIIASSLQLGRYEKGLHNQEYVKRLTFTNPTAHFPLQPFFKWTGLEGFFLPNGNPDFLEKDGILYSKDQKALCFVPVCHPSILDGSFQIPEGILHLGDCLFQNMEQLTKLTIPDSVQTVGKNLFKNCKNLEYVWMSDSITSLRPTSTSTSSGQTDEEGEIFSGCEKLSFVHLPKSLTSVGFGNFKHCTSLTLEIPEGVKRIRGKAFYEAETKAIHLPRSITKVGEDAFYKSASRIRAFEGTAKGLFSSITPSQIETPVWVEILSQDGRTLETVPIPYDYNSNLRPLLSKAWNGDHFDFSAYAQCIPLILHYQQRTIRDIMVHLVRLHLFKEEAAGYKQYCKANMRDFGAFLIEQNWEETFALFLKKSRLTKEVQAELLELCDQMERSQMRDLLLDLKKEKEMKKSQGETSSEKKKMPADQE